MRHAVDRYHSFHCQPLSISGKSKALCAQDGEL